MIIYIYIYTYVYMYIHRVLDPALVASRATSNRRLRGCDRDLAYVRIFVTSMVSAMFRRLLYSSRGQSTSLE